MFSVSAQGILTASTILPALSIVIVSLRFYVRSKQKLGLNFDDWAQIPALLLFIGMAVAAIIGVENRAFGYPTAPQPLTDPTRSLLIGEKLWYIIQLIQIPALALTKVAAFYFYKRLFVTRNGLLKTIIWTLICLTTAWAICVIVFYAIACGSHPDAAWGGYFPFEQYCLKTNRFEPAYAISDFILDTIVLLIPIPSIWRLQITMGRKIGITGIFMLALISYGASIARLISFVQIAHDTIRAAAPDIQSADTQAVWFSMLETGLAIIALNLPSIWALITHASVKTVLARLCRTMWINGRASHHDRRSYNEITGFSRSWKGSNQDDQKIELVPQSKRGQAVAMTTGDVHGEGMHLSKPSQV